MEAGKTQQFTATVFDPRDNETNRVRVARSCSDPDVGMIGRTGLFTAFAEGSTDVTASAGSVEGTVAVTIPADWLEEHTMTPEGVRLMRYVNGGWQILKTEVIGEENGKYRLRTTTPGFSTFAIAAAPMNVTTIKETNVTATATVTEELTTEPPPCRRRHLWPPRLRATPPRGRRLDIPRSMPTHRPCTHMGT
nr:PGF-pre-PGF domain-containing protein [Methanoculleus marisnigri]